MSSAVVLQILDLSIWCRSVQDASGPFSGLRESASASPQGSAAGMHDVQVNIMSAQPAVPLRSTPGTRTLVKVRYTLIDVAITTIWPGIVLQYIMTATDLIFTILSIAISCILQSTCIA